MVVSKTLRYTSLSCVKKQANAIGVRMYRPYGVGCLRLAKIDLGREVESFVEELFQVHDVLRVPPGGVSCG